MSQRPRKPSQYYIDIVPEVVRLLSEGYDSPYIQAKFGVSCRYVRNVIKRQGGGIIPTGKSKKQTAVESYIILDSMTGDGVSLEWLTKEWKLC